MWNLKKSEKKMIKNKNFTQEFIIKYKAALRVNLSREQLSELLNIKSDSLRRRRLAIFKETGLDLPMLHSSTKPISQEQLDKFNTEVLNLSNKKSQNIELNKKIYVITSAQNATPIHENFVAALKNYCLYRDAQLLVIPYRYKNPTSIWTIANDSDEWWDSSIKNNICQSDIELCKGFRIMGHIKMHPTAMEPLSGFDSYTGMDSAVFGHPKIQRKNVATPSKALPKILTTTGACTLPNYTDSKAGCKGDFHHSLAALILEISDTGIFHIRHIHADDVSGAFYDLDKYYTTNEVVKSERCAALITGDIHAEFIDSKILDATYLNEESLCNVLKPEVMIFHDLIDFYSRNHHHRGNDIIQIGKHRYGRNNVEEGLQCAADFVDLVSKNDTLNVIVKSNHDEAFDRWLKEADPKNDPENAQFYHYMKYNQCKNLKITDNGYETIDPFEFWCKNPDTQRGLINKENTVFLKRGESFVVNNVELGFHGDMGANGSKGSIKNFAAIGPKCVIGHSHSPGIYEGAYQVGVSAKLNLEYTKGQPSSWMHTHCIIYPDGKRTLIDIIEGKWRK